MKIVIDTNVFISAVFFGGLPLKVLQTVIAKQNEAYISPEIWDEYNDVIERMTKKYPSRLKKHLIDEVFKLFKVIIPSSKISICRDPDDDKFISCALDAECMYIVSGDDDLISLGKVDDITICTPAEFLNKMKNSDTANETKIGI